MDETDVRRPQMPDVPRTLAGRSESLGLHSFLLTSTRPPRSVHVRDEMRARAGVTAILLACVLGGALGTGHCPPPDGPVLRVLLVSGDPAPGLDGVTLGGPYDATWGPRSDLAFTSLLFGPGIDNLPPAPTVWVPGFGGTPRFVIAAKDPIPQIGPEVTFTGSLSQIYLGPRGEPILSLSFRWPGVGNGLRVYGAVDREGAFDPLVWAFGPVPGLPGLTFQPLSFAIQSGVNRFGEFAFSDGMAGPGVDETNDHVLLGPLGEDRLAIIARDGDPAPTDEPGAVFLDLDTRFHGAPKVDDLRRVSFHADWGLPGGPERGGLFQSHPDGTIEALFLPGDDAPGTEPRAVFGNFTRSPLVSPAGALAFSGFLAPGPGVSVFDDHGVWVVEPASSDPPRVRLAFREGDTPPGVPEDFRSYSNFEPNSINDRGDVVLKVKTTNGVELSREVLFRDGWEDRELIAMEGDPLPGMPGAQIEPTGGFINAYGDVLFSGFLRDDATGEDLGIFWAIAPAEGGGFVQVNIPPGSLIEMAPGDVREVSRTIVRLNDRRELLFEVYLDNGVSTALFCTDVPRGSPLRFHPSRCGRWRSGAPRYAASLLDDLVGEAP